MTLEDDADVNLAYESEAVLRVEVFGYSVSATPETSHQQQAKEEVQSVNSQSQKKPAPKQSIGGGGQSGQSGTSGKFTLRTRTRNEPSLDIILKILALASFNV